MSTSYETDVVAWANEQAELIRTRQFDKLDLSHIAEELQDLERGFPGSSTSAGWRCRHPDLPRSHQA